MADKDSKSLFRRLTRLFRSGPVVKRKIRALDTTMAVADKTKSSGTLLFQKSLSPTYATITSNAYNLSERLMRYQDFCFSGDTLVITPDEIGYARIDDIVARWESGDRNLWTFSYDVNNKEVVAAKITNAKCNGVRRLLSVTLDDGSIIRCTPEHRFMLKDTTYVEAKDLKPGTALMSFTNHCVVSVVDHGESENVYDIEVKGYSNFALAKKDDRLGAQGIVIVHNCEMEYCLHEDTKIAIPGGYKTIKELEIECKNNPEHTFVVYAYDHNKRKIVPAIGKQARQTRTDVAYTVTFDNGKSIIGTPNHRLMKRDGTFCKIEDLKAGDAMMPFYRRDLFNGCKEEGDGYRWIYTMDRESSMNGWVTEHRIIGEMIKGSPLSSDEVVHHMNFIKYDNSIENLQVMTDADHRSLHATILNGAKWSQNNSEWVKQFKLNHSKFMTENNPAERKDITFGRILEIAERTNFNSRKLCEVLDTDPNVIKRRLRKHGYENFETFARAYNPDWHNHGWDNQGKKNPRYDHNVTFDKICSHFSKGMSAKDLVKSLDTTITVLNNRIKERGYKNFAEFSETYDNLKVVSVEYYGVIPLYDFTVDGYKNFATDTVISHNTPEIAAALDIYADETVASDEKGRSLHIYSDNEKIRELLEELFYNVLNTEFNLRSWARNLVKFGDMFLYNDVSPEHGVINAFPIPVNEIEREENYDRDDPFAVRYRWVTLGNRTLENWEVTHFRLLGNDMFLPYGSSIVEPARRIWRQLILIEDAMLVYRVVRAPERRVFYIDVANIPANEIPAYMEKQKQSLRTAPVVDRQSGRVDLRYNPMCNSLKSLIKLHDGRVISLKDLISEWDAGKQDQWVYSVDVSGKKLVPGKVTWAGVTRKDAEIIRVTLDDGTWRDTTPDHRWMLRDGTYKRADELTPGTSLMPLYVKPSSKLEGDKIEGYEKIYDPFTQQYVYTHRNTIIQTLGFDALVGKVVHHIDLNKLNNNPDNLQPMSWADHQALHGNMICEYNKSPLGRANSSRRMKKTWEEKKITNQTFIDLWKNADVRAKRVNKLTFQIGDQFVDHLMRIMDRIGKGLSTRELEFIDAANADIELQTYLKNLNSEFKNGLIGKFTHSNLQIMLRKAGFSRSLESLKRAWLLSRYDIELIKDFCATTPNCSRKHVLDKFKLKRSSFEELVRLSGYELNAFRATYLPRRSKIKQLEQQHILNHKVVSIELLKDREDTGCITVEKYHNFACGPSLECLSALGETAPTDSWVMLHNSVEEDYLIPVRGSESGTKIDTLAGGQNAAAVEDVAYIQKKLFAALKIPRAYLGYDDMLASKATLAQEDIRFSRTINVIQKTIIAELNKLAIIHLYAHGFSDDDLQNFTLRLSNPSTVAQQQKLELWRAKFEIAGSAPEGTASKRFLRKEIWGLNDEEIKKLDNERLREKMIDAAIEAASGGAEGEPGAGGGDDLFGGGVGGDMGGGAPPDMGAGPDDAGAELPPEENAGVEPEEEEDSSTDLLTGGIDNDDDESFALKLQSIQDKPVSVNAHLKHVLYNRDRRRTHGASKTHMPDFQKMTAADNKSLTDPHGFDWLKSAVSNPFGESVVPRVSYKKLPTDVKTMLNKMSHKLDIKRQTNDLISEGIDVQDEIDHSANFVDDSRYFNIDDQNLIDDELTKLDIEDLGDDE